MKTVPLAAVAALTAGLSQNAAPPPPPSEHQHHQAPVLDASGWTRYHHKTGGFSLEHPGDWREGKTKSVLSVPFSHPTKAVHMFASAFIMTDGTLQEFAQLKFAAQSDVFRPVGETRSLDGPGWSGLVQEAETPQSADHPAARRLMLCAKHESVYVSLTLYVDPAALGEGRQDYDRIFASLRFGEPNQGASAK